MNQLEHQLSRVVIKGYKSIKNCDITLNSINVLIGSNGAGKSNFISVFDLLQNALSDELEYYSQKKGVSTFFYNGLKTTESIYMGFSFDDSAYAFEFEMSENGSLAKKFEFELFDDEGLLYKYESPFVKGCINGSFPPVEPEQWRVYHFHDTSTTSRIKMEHNISNCKTLHNDARNLAAFLYHLRAYYSAEYQKILKAVQRIAPYFKDFELNPNKHNNEHIVLRWLQKGCDDVFNASQLSDGTLRFICLATLLLQPAKLQPATIIIDEPELGLHPYAITLFAELVKKVSTRKRIILATQSVELLDHFDAEDVVVVDRGSDGSEFKRLSAEQLAAWLEDGYTLGELWNKNLFGGRISR